MCNINPSKHAWYKIKINHFSQEIEFNIFRIFISQRVWKRDTKKKKKGGVKISSHFIQSNISQLRAIKVLCIYVANTFCTDCSLKMLAVDHLTLRDILYHEFR